ncbi:MAG: tetratricopeptide repeat protein [Polyangiaceae bacterium]|nr:tetratricopeptide repeat protein [Polyangiaceae bacterium]MCW5792273.1 tetratricopeptide repeat protein [Polyangiaceae bacterium]
MKAYFTEQDPTFFNALLPALIIVALVYTRSPATNCIFDEQEALLANPYVNGDHLLWRDAFKRDFWGLPPTGSIGSYRPIPNLIWRALWRLREHPWLPHWVGLMLHAVNAALVSRLALAIAPKNRAFAWLAGLTFISSAVLTEAVTGVVGIADVLGGMGVLLALLALRLPAYLMPLGVFAALLFGLFSKESVIVAVPLTAWAALVLAPALHPSHPRRWLRALLALGSAAAALVLYTELRRRWFPVALPPELTEPLPEGAPLAKRLLHDFMRWFAQPRLPTDPINNPLVNAETPDRIAGALRVYARGLGQTLLPVTLSGDYSFPQEPIPTSRFTLPTLLGGLAMFVAPLVGACAWIASWLRERRERRASTADLSIAAPSATTPSPTTQAALSNVEAESKIHEEIQSLEDRSVAPSAATSLEDSSVAPSAMTSPEDSSVGAQQAAPRSSWWARRAPRVDRPNWSPRMITWLILAWVLVWVPLAFFPHSNIPVVLPTVRAERFWYLPVVGLSFGYAWLLTWLVTRPRAALWSRARLVGITSVTLFIGFQLLSARLHALDYTNDLTFWRATARSSPNSAKAHLNYSVMLGARGYMKERLVEGGRAKELAPEWAMAHVYYGDALCRMKRASEAWPHYLRGFELKPADQNLISLALQCLWDERAWQPHEAELLALADKYPGTWLAHLARDLVLNGEKHGGVNPTYRPRGYNEGPKKK